MGTNRKPRRPVVEPIEFVGGVEALKLELHSYDVGWPDMYRDQQQRIAEALASVDFEIEHIGSTSVPGIFAKPIIDIVVAVNDIAAEENYLNALLTAGYVLRVRERRQDMVPIESVTG